MGAESKADTYIDPVKELVDPKQDFDSTISKGKIKALLSVNQLLFLHFRDISYSSNYGKEQRKV